jgi:hypothetical protein
MILVILITKENGSPTIDAGQESREAAQILFLNLSTSLSLPEPMFVEDVDTEERKEDQDDIINRIRNQML